MSSDLKNEAAALSGQLVAWRRDFHAHPELGFQEHRSAAAIAEHLEGLGVRVQTHVGRTGVVGLVQGQQPGPAVMARFDMDALPLTEENQVTYASQNPGVMHACGHDAHIALGMGVATLMARRQSDMKGSLKLVFQPDEERLGGAKAMIEDGVMQDPRPDVFLSVHVSTTLSVGTIAVAPGPVMAAADTWRCTVRGKGGHGAMPHQTVDPIIATSQILSAVQTLVSRNVSPLDAAVVSVGSIHGGDALNIIPNEVELTGTIRTFDPEVRETVLKRLREIIENVAIACGATAELWTAPGTPAVLNDALVTSVVAAAAEAVVGPENIAAGEQTMGSEDAAFFMQDVPGCYFFVGAANAALGLDYPHHNSQFDIDEEALVLGLATLMGALAHYLL